MTPGPRAHVVARLRAAHGNLVDRVIDRSTREIPEYADLDQGGAARVNNTIRFLLPGATDLLERNEIAGSLVGMARRGGAERAADGESLEAVRSSARILFDETWRESSAALQDLKTTPALLAFALELAAWFRDLEREVLDNMLAGHLEHYGEIHSEPVRAQRRFVAALLDDTHRAERDALAARFGYSDRTFGLILLAERGNSSQTSCFLRASAASICASLEAPSSDPIETTPSPHAVVVVACGSSGDWQRSLDVTAEELSVHGLVAVALEPEGGLHSQSARYGIGRDLIGLAAVVATTSRIYYPDDLVFSRVAACIPPDLVDATLGRVVGPLMGVTARERQEYVRVLQVLRDNGYNFASAARQLRMSPARMRTARRRLERLLGARLDDPALQFNVALALHWPELVGPDQ